MITKVACFGASGGGSTCWVATNFINHRVPETEPETRTKDSIVEEISVGIVTRIGADSTRFPTDAAGNLSLLAQKGKLVHTRSQPDTRLLLAGGLNEEASEAIVIARIFKGTTTKGLFTFQVQDLLRTKS